MTINIVTTGGLKLTKFFLKSKSRRANHSPCDSSDPLLVVLLGASNLARAHRALVNHLRKGLRDRRVEFLTAMGPGRAYCVEGGFFTVKYPAISETAVIDTVRRAARRGSRIVALVTDIGNDVMYGVPAGQVIHCLDQMVTALREDGNAHVVITTIPVSPTKDMGELYFRFLRTMFFPGSRVRYEEAASAVDRINRFLEAQTDGDIHVLKAMKQYTGWDKIHFSIFRRHRGWTWVGEHILRCANVEPVDKIAWIEIVTAAIFHIIHLLICDMCRWPSWRAGTYLGL